MTIKTYVAMLVIAATAGIPASAVQLIGHRGASHDAPENTLASEKLGYTQGADGCECDIYLTKDGKIMVMHDANTLRTAGVSNIISKTTSTELRKLDVGKWGQWKDAGFSEKIPFLTELLAIIPDDKCMFIEIKCGPEILPQLKRELASSGKKPEQMALICFDYETLKQAKAQMPQYKAYFLASANRKKEYPAIETLIQKALDAKLDGLDLVSGFPIDKEFVAKVHKAGLKLYTWTVDDPEVARAEAAAGVDGITTNRPEWLRKQLTAVP